MSAPAVSSRASVASALPPTVYADMSARSTLMTSSYHHHHVTRYQVCSPTRSSFQSGRLPVHVNDANVDPQFSNPQDPVSGFQGIPRNMTCIATKLKLAGYKTHQIGKWDAGMATPDHTPHGRGYDTSFGYFEHDNDYWTELPWATYNDSGFSLECKSYIVDLWRSNETWSGGAEGVSPRQRGSGRASHTSVLL